ncbi:MAG TPA: hypothetical protein VM899_10915 [Rubellimicrobium sp.]|jgi:hypothetical protein|nr:hypothetical protein [Rubellimicrobium sp.]
MARHDPIPHHAHLGFRDTQVPMDDLIRPNLRRAFPLPSAADDKFQDLLAALAELGQVGDRAQGRSP